MKRGDIVESTSIGAKFDIGVAKGTNTFKANKGHHLQFLFLGAVDLKNPNLNLARETLAAMGWIPGPALQAQMDKEKDLK